MRRRLIMVSGASPGAGKSALSASLAQALARQGHPTRWLSEDELLQRDRFGQFDRELGANDRRAIATLVEAARELAAEADDGAMTWITDALLPGFFWLLGRYPVERVVAYGDELAALLRLLRPLIVHLDGDVSVLFGRAVAERGTAFRERMVRAIQRWELPHYPATPVRDEADTPRFFAWLNRQTLALLARWPGEVVVVDGTRAPVDALTDRLVGDLDSSAIG